MQVEEITAAIRVRGGSLVKEVKEGVVGEGGLRYI